MCIRDSCSSVGRAEDWKSSCRWFDSDRRHHKKRNSASYISGFSSSGRAPPCQGGGSEFEPRNLGLAICFRWKPSAICGYGISESRHTSEWLLRGFIYPSPFLRGERHLWRATEGVAAVSYTHLDVYKRQEKGWDHRVIEGTNQEITRWQQQTLSLIHISW